MSIMHFDSLKVTTMTVVIPLTGTINLDVVFPLLEITRFDLPPPKRQTQKYKIPYCGVSGTILSARYKGITRGIIKSQKKRSFLNAITIDISTSEKNVNLKLSKNKIHICGVKSIESAREAAQSIITKLYNVQDEMDYMNQYPDSTRSVVEWIKSTFKFNEVELPPGYLGEEQVMSIRVHQIKIPENIPEYIDKRIALFLIKQAPDFVTYEDYCTHMDWVCTIKEVITKPIEILEINKVMVNYNYDLGFAINRWELAQKINSENGFISKYQNTVDHSVTIELPYIVPDGMKIVKRKDKVPCHTFLVYKSGLVTQSGPNEELMKQAYYLFNETINKIRSHISKPGGKRKIKFVPTRPMQHVSSLNAEIVV